VLTEADMPDGWSLYEYHQDGRRKDVRHRAGPDIVRGHYGQPPFRPNLRAELTMMLSSLRRIKLSGMCLVTEWPMEAAGE